MGYGKNLDRILKERNTNVRQAAKLAGIRPTTLYSAIQRDAPLGYGVAVKLYLKLSPKFDIRSICDDVPADDPSLHRTSLGEYLKIGDKMKTARIKAGLEKQEVANLLSLSEESYDDYEQGYRQPHVEILLNFCSALSISIDDLLQLKIEKTAVSTKACYRDFEKIRLLFPENDTIIVFFDNEAADKSLELPVSHKILDKMAACNVLQICTMQGKDGKEHIAVKLD